MDKFRWCFVGTGTLAKGVIAEITATRRHTVVSAYSRNYEKLKAFCEPYGTYPAKSLDEAIDRDDVDAVYISVTNESHFEVAAYCIGKGKHVLLEKPFTIKASETEELQKMAKEKGVYLCEAMWTWFNDAPYRIKEFLEEGKLGDIKTVEMSFAENSIGYAPRVSDPVLGGGAVLDIGIYPLTASYRMFGMPKTIQCDGVLEGGIDIKESIKLGYDGFDVDIFCSIVDSVGTGLYVEGTKGCLMCPKFYVGTDAMARVEGKSVNISGGWNKGYPAEFDRVAEEIREGLTESRWVPFSATLDNMRILDECRRQMGLVYPFEK